MITVRRIVVAAARSPRSESVARSFFLRSLRSLSAIALLAALSALVACGDGDRSPTAGPSTGEETVEVVTSINVFADFVRQVGGDRVSVTPLLPSGADPHTFEPSPRDAQTINAADLIVLNGLGLEASLEQVINNSRNPDSLVLVLSDGLTPIEAEHSEEGEGQASEHEHEHDSNPHLWLDVRYAMTYVERIRDALIQVDPRNADRYRQNTEAYLRELDALDREIAEQIAMIPPERRKLVVFHDSFPYFAERYGLEIVGFVVKSPGREPSAQEVAELAQRMRDEGVPAVFREPQISARVLELAAADARVRLGVLYSDSLAEGITTYVEMMRANARQLVNLLGS